MTQTPWRFPVAQRFSGVRSPPVRDVPEVVSRGDVIAFAGDVVAAERATDLAALPGVSSRTLLLNRVSKVVAPGRRGRA